MQFRFALEVGMERKEFLKPALGRYSRIAELHLKRKVRSDAVYLGSFVIGQAPNFLGRPQRKNSMLSFVIA